MLMTESRVGIYADSAGQERSSSESEPAVLILNRVSFIGGLERYILVAMEQLSRRGYRPYLACPGKGALPEAARSMGFTVLPCEFSRMKSTRNPLRLLSYAISVWSESGRVERLCSEHDIRLIHIHSPVGALYASRAARRLGVPVIMHFHEAGRPKRLYALASRFAERVSSHLICVSEVCRSMVHEMGLTTKNSSVIYNGVNPEFLRTPPAPAREISGPGPHIGVFGMVWPLKGQDVFLEAAATIAQRYPTARFYIVGDISYEDQRPFLTQLHALSDAPPLAGRVIFAGHQSNVASWMAGMDIVVLPSVAPESFGNVLVEAMALGRPVIGTSIGGPLEIIHHGDTGLLVPPGDAKALAEAMEDIISRGPDDAMGKRASTDVRKRFSPERFGDELAQLYRDMLSDPAHDHGR